MDQNLEAKLVSLTDTQLEDVVGGIDVVISEIIEEVPELKEIFPTLIFELNRCPMCVMNGWPREPLVYNEAENSYTCPVCKRRYLA